MSVAVTAFLRRVVLVACAAVSTPALANADYPVRPVKLIVPYAAGGPTDRIARVIADALRDELGQPILVDNRGGAGGMVGSEAVANAEPDGYTVGIATVSTLTVNPLFNPRAIAINRQLTPLIQLLSVPGVISVHPSMQVKDFAGFVAALKRSPDTYSAAVAGAGTMSHLLIEAMAHTLKVKLLTVPYQGQASAVGDALSGVVQIMPDQLPTALAHIRSGKLIPVVVAGERRLSELPAVPTFKELGYPDLNDLAKSWFGLVVPAGTPPAVAERLRSAASKAVQRPDTSARLHAMGARVIASDSPAFAALVDAQLKRNQAIVQRANIRLD
ncbi:Bug family tripartite tricarboxylate transporter substrate binding protein [Pigmentiphaga litoralis]|uniref:Tripartite-type tricarboxylate transporter receptor subunit TctC n=1 Tax=Pigmentiphaga litoralis TaxID=516702 RepID=A0A7Y9IR78_9BURK|nr:tripartite-type tricarboxylate transporter receptor subunit TctC [Pigmentiphaga litoralis]NYE81581.1 tripartite-type tricarboxylate transporter receptor subunit TctC [Pigmentiphaga litoralis]